jgi:glycosyltransferase involved in cell wall biosynthesis
LIFAHFFLGGMRNAFRINNACAIDRTLCMWAVPSGVFGLAGKLVQGVPYDIWALGSDIWKIGKIPLFGKWVLRKVIRGADRVFADGRQLARDVEQLSGVRCAFLPSSRKLPLPVDRISSPEAGPMVHLLYVGRYHPNKGPDLLIRAIACLPDHLRESLRVDLYGFGPLREELTRLVGALGLENCVTVNGPLVAQECAACLRRASFLVIPSRIESIPVVFSDALQSGTPVIAAPVGDLTAIIAETGCGVVAGAVTPEALARAIGEAAARGRASFRDGVARAYGPLQLEQAVDTWLECHDL